MCISTSDFMWLLGIQVQVLVLYLQSHLPSLGHVLHYLLSHRAQAHLQAVLPTLRQLKL